MLNSWFSQKPPEAGKGVEQPRSSYDSRQHTSRPSASTTSEANPALSSYDSPRQKRSQPPYTTPHDAVIAQLQSAGTQEPITPTRKELGNVDFAGEDDRRSPITPISPAASNSRLELGLSPSPSLYTGTTTAYLRNIGNQPNTNVQTQTVDLLLDPLDGSSHGVLLPQEISIVPLDEVQAAPRFNSASVAAASEGMWSHLSKVLDLQSQIAKMHIDMEGVGGGDGRKKAQAKRHVGRASVLGEDRRMFHTPPSLRMRAMSNASTIGTVADEKEADEEGVSVTDEETERNRAREEEFAKLANQFEGKKESIREIMNKLDELSKALTEFHALQVPDVTSPKNPSTSATAPSPTIAAASNPRPGTISHASLPPPLSQFQDNMLWAPPKPVTSPESSNLNVLPKSLSRLGPERVTNKSQKPQVPTLILSSDVQPHVMESPASTLGSLPHEE